MIVYKVVVKRKRWSAVAYTEQVDDANNGRKYCLKYKKGSIVGAIPKTMGIFCFEKKEQAERFADGLDYSWSCPYWHKVIKVRGRGKPYRPRIIGYADYIDAFYQSKRKQHVQRAWQGTICFPAVEVLE
jgi:hypothetical protein